jgi:energy-coupling factor transporter ATP-binding protein EcfA2
MRHTAIYGATESGKSTLAKYLCTNALKRKNKVIVLDPFLSKNWFTEKQLESKRAFFTNSVNDFFTVLQANAQAYIFIDEAGQLLRKDPRFDQLTTIMRHWGYNVFLIAQRACQLTPTLRGQCVNVHAFRQSENDFKLIEEDIALPGLKKFATEPVLKQGEFATRVGFDGELKRLNIFEIINKNNKKKKA